MAPPMPGTSFPGIIQLARRPLLSTCRPPSTVRSRWPPRIKPKEKVLSKLAAPGMAVMRPPPASTMFGFSMPCAGRGPTPASPFSVWKKTLIPGGKKPVTCVGKPMPKFTRPPGGISVATRRAMIFLAGCVIRVAPSGIMATAVSNMIAVFIEVSVASSDRRDASDYAAIVPAARDRCL